MSARPQTPVDEAQRLAQLKALFVLDSAPEPVFDSLARLASQVCGAPIALLSLIDAQRQWFKAEVGLPGVRQTPRDVAFCAHAIQGDELFQVKDAARDPRFADNPLVTGAPHIRFYAGAPLVLPGGARMGTLCVIDREARELDAGQLQMLKSLADIACQALLMRQSLITKSLSVRSEYEDTLLRSEERHRALVEDQAELVSLSQPDGRLLYVNPAYARHFGCTVAQMVGTDLFAYIDPADREAVRAVVGQVVQSGLRHRGENRMVSADGSALWVEWTNTLQQGPQGQPLLHSVGRDVTERHVALEAEEAAQLALQRQTAALRAVVEVMPAMIAVNGHDERYQLVNSAFERWIGLPREQILGRTPKELVGEQAAADGIKWARRALAGETVSFEHEVPPSHPMGATHLSVTFMPLRLDNGEVTGLVSVAQDVTRHKQEEVRLLQLAHRDPLTGLLNRAGFEQVLEAALTAGGGPMLGLLYIDLDHFKPVNDRHGHAVGDALLQQFAQRLRALVRPTDAVARLGGDEFAVAIGGLPDIALARSLAEKVLAAAQAPFEHGALTLQVAACVGVAFGVASGEGWRELLARADALLYRAKAEGRCRHASEAGAGGEGG